MPAMSPGSCATCMHYTFVNAENYRFSYHEKEILKQMTIHAHVNFFYCFCESR